MRICIYDKKHDAQILENIINDYELKNVIIDYSDDIDHINRTYDLVFVNVDLLDNIIVEMTRLKKKCSQTIFIYVVESVEHLNELFYTNEKVNLLAKPYKEEYVRMIIKKNYRYQSSVLTIKTRYGENKISMDIPLEDIYYIVSDRRIIEVHGREDVLGKSYLKLSVVEATLPDNFVRTHQSYIINKDYVKKITWNTIYLSNSKDKIPISRSRLAIVRKELDYKGNI